MLSQDSIQIGRCVSEADVMQQKRDFYVLFWPYFEKFKRLICLPEFNGVDKNIIKLYMFILLDVELIDVLIDYFVSLCM